MKTKSKPPKNNPVAKFANKFNKAARFRDRKHDYQRKSKHPNKDQ